MYYYYHMLLLSLVGVNALCTQKHLVMFNLKHFSASITAAADDGHTPCDDADHACDLHFIGCIERTEVDEQGRNCACFYNGDNNNRVLIQNLNRAKLENEYNGFKERFKLTLIILDTDHMKKKDYKPAYILAMKKTRMEAVSHLWYKEIHLTAKPFMNETYYDDLPLAENAEECASTTGNTTINTNSSGSNTTRMSTTTSEMTRHMPSKHCISSLEYILIGGFIVLGILCLIIIFFLVRVHLTNKARAARNNEDNFKLSAKQLNHRDGMNVPMGFKSTQASRNEETTSIFAKTTATTPNKQSSGRPPQESTSHGSYGGTTKKGTPILKKLNSVIP